MTCLSLLHPQAYLFFPFNPFLTFFYTPFPIFLRPLVCLFCTPCLSLLFLRPLPVFLRSLVCLFRSLLPVFFAPPLLSFTPKDGIFNQESIPRSHFQGIDSASLCGLAGRYDNPISTRFVAPIDCLKIPALNSWESLAQILAILFLICKIN